MKNMMLIISIIIGYCFANAGILADKNESAFGIWAKVSRVIDCEDCEETKEVSLDYMTKVGVEIGLSAGQIDSPIPDVVDGVDIVGAHLGYHFKSNSLYKKGTSFYIDYAMKEYTWNWDELPDEPYAENTIISFGVYSNSKAYFEISQLEASYSDWFEELYKIVYDEKPCDNGEYSFDCEPQFVKFGGILRFGQSAGFNIGYKIDVDLLDAMFENEDLELLKFGTLELSIGGNF